MKKWQAISNLNCARSGHQLVVCDDYVYALGGWNFSSTLSSVEWLNSLADKWQYGKPMKPRENILQLLTTKLYLRNWRKDSGGK